MTRHYLLLLLSSSLQAAALLGAAGLVGLALRRAPAARHLVLTLAVIGALAMPLLSRLTPPLRTAAPAESPPGLLAAPLPPGGVREALRAAPAALSAQAARFAAWADTPAPAAATPEAAALLLWAAVALALLGRWLLSLRAAADLARRARPDEGGPAADALAAAAREAGCAPPPLRWHRSPDLLPMTVGLLRPAILLPDAARGWSAERLRLVLLHELAHVTRRDCLTQALALLCCALYWPLPLPWLAARRMRALREAAADDQVLAAGARASDYARHLLDIAQALRSREPRLCVAALPLREGLEGRLRALLRPDHRPAPLSRGRALALCLGAAALALPLSALRAGPALPAALGAAAPPAARAAASSATAQIEAEVRGHLGQPGRPLPPQARVELTLDPALQAAAEDEVDAIVSAHHPQAAVALILDPRSGELRALAGRGPGGRPAPLLGAQAAFDTGSTMKPLTVAAALAAGTIRRDQRFFCENGSFALRRGAPALHDAAPHGELSVGEVLAVSSNIGAAKIYQTLGREALLGWLGRLRFGQAPPLPLPGLAAGSEPRPTLDDLEVASIGAGEGLQASPLQLAAAFAVVAGDGTYRAPVLVRGVRGPAGEELYRPSAGAERLIPAEIAAAVRELLLGVTESERGTGRLAALPGVHVAGKTGTARRLGPDGRYAEGHYYASFVGAVPAERPRLLILVGVDDPKGPAGGSYTGATVAAPAFRRLASRALGL